MIYSFDYHIFIKTHSIEHQDLNSIHPVIDNEELLWEVIIFKSSDKYYLQ